MLSLFTVLETFGLFAVYSSMMRAADARRAFDLNLELAQVQWEQNIVAQWKFKFRHVPHTRFNRAFYR